MGYPGCEFGLKILQKPTPHGVTLRRNDRRRGHRRPGGGPLRPCLQSGRGCSIGEPGHPCCHDASQQHGTPARSPGGNCVEGNRVGQSRDGLLPGGRARRRGNGSLPATPWGCSPAGSPSGTQNVRIRHHHFPHDLQGLGMGAGDRHGDRLRRRCRLVPAGTRQIRAQQFRKRRKGHQAVYNLPPRRCRHRRVSLRSHRPDPGQIQHNTGLHCPPVGALSAGRGDTGGLQHILDSTDNPFRRNLFLQPFNDGGSCLRSGIGAGEGRDTGESGHAPTSRFTRRGGKDAAATILCISSGGTGTDL